MARHLDLNELRENILRNPGAGQERPSAPARKVVVDSQGRIMLKRDAGATDERQLSEVPQGIFAAGGWLTRDRAVVAQKLPGGTYELDAGGITGWVYQVIDELDQRYVLFVYPDQGLYSVKVLSPDVEGKYGPHDGHLYADGRICLGAHGGLPTLEEAYAKSVLWATGFTVFTATGSFPFSANNEPGE